VAEATNTNGTVLGGIVTFILYGILPTAIIIYIMRTPHRKRVRLALEKEALEILAIKREDFSDCFELWAAIATLSQSDPGLANESEKQMKRLDPLNPTLK
jgi:hypothetical protein